MAAPADRRLTELEFLERIVRATAETANHGELLKRIIDDATSAAGVEVCSLYLWQASEKSLLLVATNGLTQSAVGKLKLALGEGVTGWVAAQGQPVAVRDTRYESRFKWIPGIDQDRFVSMLSTPIKARGQMLGVINFQTAKPRIFNDDEITFAQAIAAQIAGILELSSARSQAHAELQLERATVDQLLAFYGSDSHFAAVLTRDFLAP
ncbi:MAG: GAF domain-containing protein, partial [Chloroflexi bacterium]|nr:GAF domain-containing protein [Chloroflexota bacterium]